MISKGSRKTKIIAYLTIMAMLMAFMLMATEAEGSPTMTAEPDTVTQNVYNPKFELTVSNGVYFSVVDATYVELSGVAFEGLELSLDVSGTGEVSVNGSTYESVTLHVYGQLTKAGEGSITYGAGGLTIDQDLTATITVAPEVTDQEKVAADIAALTADVIKGDNPDLSNVTMDLNLTTVGAVYGCDISWDVSGNDAVSEGGTVTRPAYDAADITGDIVATVTSGVYSDTKTFTVTVLKEEAPEVDKSALEAKIAEAQALVEMDYLPETWGPFAEALAAAAAVYEDPDATQEEVSNALTALTAAMEGLEEAAELGEEVLIAPGTEVITFKGGIQLDLGNLDIPEGVSVTVTVELVEGEELPEPAAGMETAGAVIRVTFVGDIDFTAGVKLTLPLNEGTPTRDIAAFFYDEEVGQWHCVDSEVYEEPRVVIATVYHFSIFGVFEADTVDTPTADPSGGAVRRGTSVELSTATEDATIYYTTDGTEPTTASNEYTDTDPITVNAAITVKAVAVKPGMIDSAVATFEYTIRSVGGGGGGVAPVSGTLVTTSGGKVTKLGATIEIPAGALTSSIRVEVAKVTDTSDLPVPDDCRLVSDVLEITKDRSGDFKKAVTITMPFDKAEVDADQETISIYWLDEEADVWVELENVEVDWEAGKVSGEVDHFTKFAVLATEEVPAVPEQKVVKLTIGQTHATIDGAPYVLDAVPFVRSETDRTLVPVRFVSEALGAEVEWVAETRQVVIEDDGITITLGIGSTKVLVNGAETTLDSPAELLPPGRTFVPLRFVSETLGATVDYDETTKEITITR